MGIGVVIEAVVSSGGNKNASGIFKGGYGIANIPSVATGAAPASIDDSRAIFSRVKDGLSRIP